MSDEVPEALRGHEAAIDGLREAGRLFHQRGWSVGTSSNYSVVIGRDPLDLVVTASGKDKGRLTRADFVRVDGEGRPVVPGQPRSSAETLLHVVAAERAGVNAVLHTHSIWTTLLSDLHHDDGGLEIEGYEMLKGLEGVGSHEHRAWIPIFENTQDIPQLARQVREQWDDPLRPIEHGYLIRRHGLYTWGRDLEEARRHVEVYEFLFECVVRRRMLLGGAGAGYRIGGNGIAF